MEKPVQDLYESLQRLIGLHRQLMDVMRAERDVLVQADLKGIQDVTAIKQGLLQQIHQTENLRIKATANLALLWKKPLRDLSLSNIVIEVQGTDLKAADMLRSALNALTILIQRIIEQNRNSKLLVERSLEHVHEMKRNVLGEGVPNSQTYTPSGQKSGPVQGARLLSKEA